MRSSRIQLMVSLGAIGGLAIVIFIALAGYFSAVERSSTVVPTEARIVAQLRGLHEQLKEAQTPEEANNIMKNFELTSGFGSGSTALKEIRKAYAPVLAAFASKPREAESRYLLIKKRELMEALVNAYRKEIPNGDIPVRAAYLNILFDTQASLLNENDETEAVYLSRNKERWAALRPIIRQNDQGLILRVNNLESIFQAYEKGFELAANWRKEKMESLSRTEKGQAQLAKTLYLSFDDDGEGQRRSFLVICLIAFGAVLMGCFALYVTHKVVKIRFENRAEALIQYLKEFGREKTDPLTDKGLSILREDDDWAPVLQKALEAEETFVAKYQGLISIPKSMKIPYLVFSKDREAKLWNDSAKSLFNIEDGQKPALDEIIREDLISTREGEASAIVDMIRHSFPTVSSDTFDLLIKDGEEWSPMELIVSPIVHGPLAGGKVFLFKEIRNESERIDRAINAQLAKVRDFVHKITHFYPLDEEKAFEGEAGAVKAIVGDLRLMKEKIDEREIHWKSEAEALIDQVERQREILGRLTNEMNAIREEHGKAISLVKSIQESDENWHDEVCVIERDLERWISNRHRLVADLTQHATVIEKARDFEEQLRTSTAELKQFLQSYESEIVQLTEFSEAARVHAVNLGFVKDPGYWEFAARSRGFAHELGRFSEKVTTLAKKLRTFLSEFPGGALAPYLDASDLDPTILQALKEEQEKLSTFLKRWKESGQGLVSEGEEAMRLLQSADKKGGIIAQLSETSLLINDQAKENLQRWN